MLNVKEIPDKIGYYLAGFAAGEGGALSPHHHARLRQGVMPSRGTQVCQIEDDRLPHLALREALPEPTPTKGNGSPKKWVPRTPAMAAGLTDHVWTIGEFLLFRVPPWRQEVTAA